MSSSVALAPAIAVVAVDVGKRSAAALVSDAQRRRLLGPIVFSMTAAGLAEVITKTRAVLPAGLIRVGVEAAGHYHRPLAAPAVWPGWQVVELNPAHVSEQRRVMGRRRVKTDVLDLEAITELLLAGRGVPVSEPSTAITQLTAWVGHRRLPSTSSQLRERKPLCTTSPSYTRRSPESLSPTANFPRY
jgi:transposase